MVPRCRSSYLIYLEMVGHPNLTSIAVVQNQRRSNTRTGSAAHFCIIVFLVIFLCIVARNLGDLDLFSFTERVMLDRDLSNISPPGRQFNFFLGGGQIYLLFFNATGLLKNWEKTALYM